MIEKAKEGMDDEEAQFSVQHELEKQAFLWSDKYRPRKPRFFNRVHTVSITYGYVLFNRWPLCGSTSTGPAVAYTP